MMLGRGQCSDVGQVPMLVFGNDFVRLCTTDLGRTAWFFYDGFITRSIHQGRLGCIKVVETDVLISQWECL